VWMRDVSPANERQSNCGDRISNQKRRLLRIYSVSKNLSKEFHPRRYYSHSSLSSQLHRDWMRFPYHLKNSRPSSRSAAASAKPDATAPSSAIKLPPLPHKPQFLLLFLHTLYTARSTTPSKNITLGAQYPPLTHDLHNVTPGDKMPCRRRVQKQSRQTRFLAQLRRPAFSPLRILSMKRVLGRSRRQSLQVRNLGLQGCSAYSLECS
jgi:hypothetical protein